MYQRHRYSTSSIDSSHWAALARAALVAVLVTIGGLVIQSPAKAALCSGPASCGATSALFSAAALDGTSQNPTATTITAGACANGGVSFIDAVYGLICLTGPAPLVSSSPYAGLNYPFSGGRPPMSNPYPFGVHVGGSGPTQTYRTPATTPVGGNTPAVGNSLVLQPAGAAAASLGASQSSTASLYSGTSHPSSSGANDNLPGTVPATGSASSAYFAAQNNASSTSSTAGSSNGQVVCGTGPALTVTANPSSPVTAGQSVTIAATPPSGGSSPQYMFRALLGGAWTDLQQDWSNLPTYTLDTTGYAPGTDYILVWERDGANTSNQTSAYAMYGGVQITVTGSGAAVTSSQDPSVLPAVSYQGTSYPVNAQCL